MPQTTHSKPAQLELRPSVNRPERREEVRIEVQGEVQLFIDNPEPLAISAVLLDMSKSGFRARHHCPYLSSGSEVRFLHQSARGKARVMWSRVLPDFSESGLLIVR